MTRNTASNIATDLLSAGLVIETEFRREGAGRPGLLLELAPNGGFAIGAEIDISRIIVVALDFKGKTLWKETARITPKQSQKKIIATAEQLVQSALAQPRANVRIKVSGRDDDGVFGAACLVLDAIINDPVPLVRAAI